MSWLSALSTTVSTTICQPNYFCCDKAAVGLFTLQKIGQDDGLGFVFLFGSDFISEVTLTKYFFVNDWIFPSKLSFILTYSITFCKGLSR